MKKVNSQSGSLLITAAVLIAVVGLLTASTAYLVSASRNMVKARNDSAESFYIAEAGLQNALTLLHNQQISCLNINGDSNLTDKSFADGTFTVTAMLSTLNPSATLSTAIDASQTYIPVDSLSNLTPLGRVRIDYENVNYTGISSNPLDCGSDAPCLTGATRGVDGSSATSHASGTAIGQINCLLQSTAYIPDSNNPMASNPIATQTAKANYTFLRYAWLVGDRNNNTPTLGYWDNKEFQRYSLSSMPNRHLNAIVGLSYADAWAVGNNHSSNAFIIHWNGQDWSRVYPNPAIDNTLYGIDCVSAHDCWTVGNNRTFIHYNGSNWLAGNVKTNGNKNNGQVPNVRIRSVSCSGANDCWAVGNADSNDPLFIRWNGTQWQRVLDDGTVPAKNLYSVSCPASNSCWTVGPRANKNVTIAHWNGSTWTRVQPSPKYNVNLNAVYCTSASNCWAVGDRYSNLGLILHYNGSSWTRTTPSSTVNQALNAVNCGSNGRCLAVGDQSMIAYYNGSSWSKLTPASGFPSVSLNGVSLIDPANATNEAFIYWHQ